MLEMNQFADSSPHDMIVFGTSYGTALLLEKLLGRRFAGFASCNPSFGTLRKNACAESTANTAAFSAQEFCPFVGRVADFKSSRFLQHKNFHLTSEKLVEDVVVPFCTAVVHVNHDGTRAVCPKEQTRIISRISTPQKSYLRSQPLVKVASTASAVGFAKQVA